MNRVLDFVSSAALGAGLMYLFDPNQGRRRRALLADQCNHLIRQTRQELDRGLRDARNRGLGFVAEMRSALSDEPVDDEVLTERIRSKLGRYVSHPSAVRVSAKNGRATLSGPILAGELEPLLEVVKRMSGVQEVDNQLKRHESSERVPELQGNGASSGEHWNLLEQRWAPATRLGIFGGGGLLLAYTLARISPGTVVLGALAAGLSAAARSRDLADRQQAESETTVRDEALPAKTGAGANK